MTLRKLLNQRGFSLIELMIGGAILVGLGLAGAYIVQSQRAGQKQVENLRDLQVYHQQLTRQMTHTLTCNRVFGIGPTVAYKGSSAQIVNPEQLAICEQDCNNADAMITKAILKGSWIDERQVWQITDWNVPTIEPGTVFTGVEKIEMNVIYTLNPKLAGFGYPSVNKTITFGVRYDDSGTPKECIDIDQSSVNSMQSDLCLTNSGTGQPLPQAGNIFQWDEVDQRCTLVEQVKDCDQGGVFVKSVETNGVAKCIPIQEKVSPKSIDSETVCTSGNVQLFVDTDGKMTVVCEPASGGCGGTPINGAWSDWNDLGPWSACEDGIQSKDQFRECIMPIQTCGGTGCIGESTQTVSQTCTEGGTTGSSTGGTTGGSTGGSTGGTTGGSTGGTSGGGPGQCQYPCGPHHNPNSLMCWAACI